ncbi:hypothetical protein Fmac_001531 [Flemingia macrophylla]|uniref:Uncharacterized protein n=1 Tax=Flemingia macrophylla TaxID=520843 RepID=A0ABD1NHC9_9FABA
MELMKDMVPQLIKVIHVAPNEHVENFIVGDAFLRSVLGGSLVSNPSLLLLVIAFARREANMRAGIVTFPEKKDFPWS